MRAAIARFEKRNTDPRLTLIISSQFSFSNSWIERDPPMPALLTRMSSAPNALAAFAKICSEGWGQEVSLKARVGLCQPL